MAARVPFGWYGNYYYPGIGNYVYDSYRRRHARNTIAASYWIDRRSTWHGPHRDEDDHWEARAANWSGFDRQTARDTTQAGSPAALSRR